jgi:hypothetical protein
MGLGIFEETFGAQRIKRTSVRRNEQTAEYLVEVTAAVQSVVDTFRDPRTGDRYVVGLSDKVEAFANSGEKRIVVTHQPLLDKGLRVATACTVMTGLVLHEVGHTLYTFPVEAAFKRRFGDRSQYRGWGTKPYDALAYTIWNIGDDARLEARMAENLPVARDIFPSTLHWVALRSGMVGTRRRWTGSAMKMSERVNFAGCAIRYPWTQVWHKDAATIGEREWWQAWFKGFIALADDDEAGLIAAVEAATDRLRDPNDPVEEDETEPGDEPDEDETEETNPGDDFDTEDDDEDEDEDGDEPDEDESDDGDEDEDGDESDEDGDDDGDADGDDDEADDDETEPGDEPSDEDGEDEGEGGSDTDEDADDDEADDDETEPGKGKVPGGEGEYPTDEKGEGKVDIDGDDDDLDEDDVDDDEVEDDGSETESQSSDGPIGMDPPEEKPDPTSWEQDFNASDLQGRVDELNHGNDGDWEAQKQASLVQQLLNEERSIDKVKSGEWGTARVEVRDPLDFLAKGIGPYRR